SRVTTRRRRHGPPRSTSCTSSCGLTGRLPHRVSWAIPQRPGTGHYNTGMGSRWFVPGLAAVMLPALFAQQATTAPAGCNNTPAYTPCELVFELTGKDAAAHPNPYVTVDLRVEFRSPRRRTYAMPAFWDGGARMIVRFSPTEGGQWDYHVTSSIAEW